MYIGVDLDITELTIKEFRYMLVGLINTKIDKKVVLSTAYFPSVEYIYELKYGDVRIEGHENFVRQTLRNRCELLSDKGIQRLSVPIVWRHGQKMAVRSVEVDYSQPWQRTHLRTIKTCYASSAYFEHFYGEVESLLSRKDKFLFDYNIAITEWLLGRFRIDKKLIITDEYCGVDGVGEVEKYEYYQVFSEKMEFVGGLSSLDMLFCEGRYIL